MDKGFPSLTDIGSRADHFSVEKGSIRYSLDTIKFGWAIVCATDMPRATRPVRQRIT
jgi:hypothetical protein